jgi:hypothetical protein
MGAAAGAPAEAMVAGSCKPGGIFEIEDTVNLTVKCV